MSQLLSYPAVKPSANPRAPTDRAMRPHSPAFTLIELLVATAVLSLVLVLVLSVISQTSTVWRRSTDKIEAFQSARMAFDILTRNLSQATLNTYLDYDRVDPPPTQYIRKAELKFLSTNAGQKGGTPGTGQAVFFQAPANFTEIASQFGGLDGLLNTVGYYVEYGSDKATQPSFVKSAEKYRYRLMQLLVPTEKNSVYKTTGQAWVDGFSLNALPVADNIIALIIRPQAPGMTSPPAGVTPPNLTTDYTYDSAVELVIGAKQPLTSNQLPPVIQVTMVAIDESAAKRLDNGSAPPTVISSALSGKFKDPARYDTDLRDLETALNSATPPIPYRIFSSAVPIRESKWTK